jgi:hypothetical protein
VPDASEEILVTAARGDADAFRRVLADQGYAYPVYRRYLRQRGIPCTMPQGERLALAPRQARPAARLRPGGLPPAQRRRALRRPPQALPRPGHPLREDRRRLALALFASILLWTER